MKSVLVPFLALTISAFAQVDPGIQAAQDAAAASAQASQQAMQDAQRASQQASDANQRAMDDAQRQPLLVSTDPPRFTASSGRLAPGTEVRITTRTHYATIYYTTDGWKPTRKSQRYLGPIKVDRSMVLQAIAISPDARESIVSRADYIVNAPAQPQPAALTTDGVLHAGTLVRLATASEASSKTAKIGDHLQLRLDQDITDGARVLVPKGTPVDALITLADSSGHVGVPGDLAFEVQALNAGGVRVPVSGGETIEGVNHYKRVMGLAIIPVVGEAAAMSHGGDAIIKPGMLLQVQVTQDTPLSPNASSRPSTAPDQP